MVDSHNFPLFKIDITNMDFLFWFYFSIFIYFSILLTQFFTIYSFSLSYIICSIIILFYLVFILMVLNFLLGEIIFVYTSVFNQSNGINVVIKIHVS